MSVIDRRNLNTLWSSVLVETCSRLGVKTAIVCPGSRSAPLTVALAAHPKIEAIPVLDERSASFFALGIAKRSRFPVLLVCTSGTAGANFYPAIIEARESQVPLLVLSADRPPELRDCHSGQAIDQQKLYGTYPNWYAELALPEATLDRLRYLRQTAVQAVRRSLFPVAGPVHLNVPFRDPLAPISQPLPDFTLPESFFQHLDPSWAVAIAAEKLPLETWQTCDRGIILAGVDRPENPERYCQAIASLAAATGWVVLAEGLSPVRHRIDLVPNVIAAYDFILRDLEWARSLAPEMVVQVGAMPTSKQLRIWLGQTQPRRWILDSGTDNFDPLHARTTHLPLTIAQFLTLPQREPRRSNYGDRWRNAEEKTAQTLTSKLTEIEHLFAGKVAWLLSQWLPPNAQVFIANSTPVRDVEWFWQKSDRGFRLFCNRGANGIDGTLSTALGMSHRQDNNILLTGDLALLHDTNGFLASDRWVGNLTVVLINNNGGGIFSLLPIAQFEPPFEDYFATPQKVNFARLCAAYGVEHCLIQNWEELRMAIASANSSGLRVLELVCDRDRDARDYRDRFSIQF